ncbi:MAG: hypothetical protein JOZ69_02370, partial [Myxococcales bacterium]|nr:hypothetical protein [Myxococcales bacterium]
MTLLELVALVALGAAPSGGCTARPACNGVSCAPACPQGADRDASGRCACSGGDALLLGACVSQAVADAYCGPAARFT